MNNKARGYTLIELVIAVSIMAILTRIGFVSYQGYIARSNRTLARGMLVKLAAKQEQLFLQTGAYAYNDFTSLTGASGSSAYTTFYINQDGAIQTSGSTIQSASDSNTIYAVSFANADNTGALSAASYAIKASAQGLQAKRDTGCQTLILNYTGLKQAQTGSGTAVSDPTSCWDK
jgi:type IV pilus assembly protein PilE